MTALDLMLRLRDRYEQSKSLNELLEIRRAMVTNETAGYGEKQGGGARKDRFAEHVARADELLSEINRVKKDWQMEMDLCARLCEKLGGAERAFLYKYYGKSWSVPAVARESGYSEGYMRQVKRRVDEWLEKMSYESCHMGPEYDKNDGGTNENTTSGI